jgi:serine/threonine-protein kinase RsbW
MRIQLVLSLPREAISVPLTRHTVCSALLSAGVEATCVAEVELAISEACTNAVQHAVNGSTYEVLVNIGDEQVTVDVVDSGCAFGQRAKTSSVPSDHLPEHVAEDGRGMSLIAAFADSAVFDSVTGESGSVHLVKRLRWRQSSTLYPVGGSEDGAIHP